MVSGLTYQVTVSDVKTIFDTGLTDPSIQAAIDAAATLYRDQIGTGISNADTRNLVIKYLAAHFLCVQSPRVASRGHGRTSESYQGQTSTGLNASMYGQMAQTLDTTGTLAQLEQGGATAIFVYNGDDIAGESNSGVSA